MSKRIQLYRRTFRALHGKNERLLTRAIVKAIRSELNTLPPLQQENFESYLKQLEFKELEKAIVDSWIKSGQIGTFVYNEIEGLREKRINPFFSEIWAMMVFNNSKAWIGSKIVSIKGTLLEDIKTIVKQALIENITLSNITTIIQEAVKKPDFYRWQAQRIARTETTSAMNTAMEVAGKESNLVMDKVWITAGDEKVRSSHAALDGTVVPMDAKFANGLTKPGDPSGSAGEIINCRCNFAYRPVRDGNGNFIIR